MYNLNEKEERKMEMEGSEESCYVCIMYEMDKKWYGSNEETETRRKAVVKYFGCSFVRENIFTWLSGDINSYLVFEFEIGNFDNNTNFNLDQVKEEIVKCAKQSQKANCPVVVYFGRLQQKQFAWLRFGLTRNCNVNGETSATSATSIRKGDDWEEKTKKKLKRNLKSVQFICSFWFGIDKEEWIVKVMIVSAIDLGNLETYYSNELVRKCGDDGILERLEQLGSESKSKNIRKNDISLFVKASHNSDNACKLNDIWDEKDDNGTLKNTVEWILNDEKDQAIQKYNDLLLNFDTINIKSIAQNISNSKYYQENSDKNILKIFQTCEFEILAFKIYDKGKHNDDDDDGDDDCRYSAIIKAEKATKFNLLKEFAVAKRIIMIFEKEKGKHLKSLNKNNEKYSKSFWRDIRYSPLKRKQCLHWCQILTGCNVFIYKKKLNKPIDIDECFLCANPNRPRRIRKKQEKPKISKKEKIYRARDYKMTKSWYTKLTIKDGARIEKMSSRVWGIFGSDSNWKHVGNCVASNEKSKECDKMLKKMYNDSHSHKWKRYVNRIECFDINEKSGKLSQFYLYETPIQMYIYQTYKLLINNDIVTTIRWFVFDLGFCLPDSSQCFYCKSNSGQRNCKFSMINIVDELEPITIGNHAIDTIKTQTQTQTQTQAQTTDKSMPHARQLQACAQSVPDTAKETMGKSGIMAAHLHKRKNAMINSAKYKS